MDRFYFLFCFFVSFAHLFSPEATLAEPFKSCAEISSYLDRKIQFDNRYERYCALEKAIVLINSQCDNPEQKCDDRLTDRTFLKFAQVADDYAQKNFTANTKGREKWSLYAARAYHDYIDWFLTISSDRQTTLIAKLINVEPTDPNFEDKKRSWLRTRIGGALRSVGNIYVREGKPEELINCYENCFDSNKRADIFANEVVGEWYKWLLAQPDYKITATHYQAKLLISQCPACKNRWALFKDFLDKFILTISDASYNIKEYWITESGRINEWVSSN